MSCLCKGLLLKQLASDCSLGTMYCIKKKLEIACLPMHVALFCLYFYLYYTCSITNALTGYKHNIAVQLNSPIYAFKDKARYVT